MSTIPLRGTSWPLSRQLSTAQVAALTAGQIRAMPVNFMVVETGTDGGGGTVVVQVWFRDNTVAGSLLPISGIPITLAGDVTGPSNNNTVSELQGTTLVVNLPVQNDFLMVNALGQIVNQQATVAALAVGSTYVEEIDVPTGDPNRGVSPNPLTVGVRYSRLVAASFVVTSVGPAAPGAHTFEVLDGGGAALATFDFDQNEALATANYAARYDITIATNVAQVAPAEVLTGNFSAGGGDIGFRLILTWKVMPTP